MGWDAYAFDTERKWPLRRKYLRQFVAAAKLVRKQVGCVDFMLQHGGLDVSTCARMLEDATGETCWTTDEWSPDKVQMLVLSSRWRNVKDVPEGDRWAWYSARAFLVTCARLSLGIRFTF